MKAKIDSRKKIAAAKQKFESGDLTKALAEVEDVLRLDETNTDARSLKEQIELACRDQADKNAAAALERAEHEADPEARVRLLAAAAAASPGNQRLKLTLALYEAQRDVLMAKRARALVFEKHGEWDQALDEYAAIQKLAPGEPNLRADIERATRGKSAPPPVAATQAPAAAPAPKPVKAEPAPKPVIAKPPAKSTPKPAAAATSRRSPLVLYGAIAVALLVLGVAGIVLKNRSASPAGLRIEVQPADARIEIDGTPYAGDASKLAAGKHTAVISRPGYATLQQEFTLPGAVTAALQPLAPQFRIDTNLAAAEFLFDDRPPQPLEGGQAVVNDLTPGRHVIKVRDAKEGEATLEFETRPADLPRIAALNSAKEMVAFAVGSFETNARLYTSAPGLPVRHEEGSDLGQIDAGGLPLSGVRDVTRVVAGSGDQQWQLYISKENRPVVSLFLRANATTGGFLARVDEDDAVIRIDGHPAPGARLRKGELRAIRGIDFGRHEIRIDKPGYRSEPPFFRIAVARGKEERLDFHLIAVASIEIKGAAPLARVLVNDRDIGALGADGSGTLTAAGVKGPCKIELRREGYETRVLDRECKPGAAVAVNGADAAMGQTNGYLSLTVQPAGARITVQRAGDPEREIKSGGAHLPPGKYTVRVTAPGFEDSVSPGVEVTKNRTNSMGEITLKPKR